jgi:hypothetical protein
MINSSDDERLKIIESTPHLITCDVLKSDFKFLINKAKLVDAKEIENARLREALQRACISLGADIEDYL